MLLKPKRFYLLRETDISGTSGTGIVAVGVVLHTGKVMAHWFTNGLSCEMCESIDSFCNIHLHGSASKLVWIDEKDEFLQIEKT